MGERRPSETDSAAASTFLTHTGGRADLELPPKTRRRISQTAHHPALRTRNGVTPAGESLITNAIPSVSNRLSVLLQTGAEIAMQSCCTANVHWNTRNTEVHTTASTTAAHWCTPSNTMGVHQPNSLDAHCLCCSVQMDTSASHGTLWMHVD